MQRLASLTVAATLAAGLSACTAKSDGPTPSVGSVAPNVICTAQQPTQITISGANFSPVVVDGLTGSKHVVLPTVTFVSSSGQTDAPASGVSVPDTTGTMLDVTIPVGLIGPTAPGDPEVVYDVMVTNPTGNSGTLTGALTVVPPPSLTAVDPTSGAQGTTVTVTLTGTGFRDGMTVTLDATPVVNGANVTVGSPTSASADFDLTGVAPGTYGITVQNADGCSATLDNAFTVYVPKEITITGIDPPFGCTCDDTTVTITGAGGFVSTPRVEMRPHGQATPVIDLERVAFIDGSTLTAVVPGGNTVGDYDVTVINPPSDGGVGVLDNGFRVVANPVPTIEAIVPSRGDPAADQDVSIFGDNFRDPVKVELLDRGGNIVGTVPSTTPVSATQIDVTLPISGLLEDAYLVRVTDLDENTYSTFSSFIVGKLGPSGNLHEFATARSLNTGRRMLAGTSGRDNNNNTYLYAIGGDTGSGGNVLPSVEVSQLSKFGALSSWSETPNQLMTGRVGAAAVTVPIYDPSGSPFVPIKSYLYVIGGQAGDGTILDTVERAVILSTDDAPNITSIGASSTAGSLAAGTWYYKVSAVLDATDPDNPSGETLASDEAIITIGGTTGAIDLAWDPVSVNGKAAVSYRVYRTDAVNGASQTEQLIATVTDTSYTDTGDTTTAETPLPDGSMGVWVDAGTINVARWGHQAAVVEDPNGDRYIFVVGGKTNATNGYSASVEYASVNDTTGAIASFSTSAATDLAAGRAFFSLAVETHDEVNGFGAGARLFVTGGVVGSAAVSSTAYADVSTGGGNGSWTAGPDLLNNRAGPMSVIRTEKLFTIGGAQMASDTGVTNVRNSSYDAEFDVSGNIAGTMNSAAQTMSGPRALGVVLKGSGFIYFIGGTSNGTDAVKTVESTF